MYSATRASGFTRPCTNSMRSLSRAASSTTDAWAIPSDASSTVDLTNSGKRSFRGTWKCAPRGNTANCGVAMRWKARSCLLSDLSREQEPARIAAGVGLAHQLEKGHHVLIVGDDAVEFLEQVEHDVRLPLGDRAAQLRQAVEHAEAAHVMLELAERRDDVVLGAPLLDFLFAVTFETLRRHQALVHHGQGAQLPHSGRCGV